MARRGENLRFWLPVAGLLLLAGYSTQKVVRAHVDPSVDSIDYSFRRELPDAGAPSSTPQVRRSSSPSPYGTTTSTPWR